MVTSRKHFTNTFSQTRINHTQTIAYKLDTALEGIREYVSTQVDLLANTSWPYELVNNNVDSSVENEENTHEKGPILGKIPGGEDASV